MDWSPVRKVEGQFETISIRLTPPVKSNGLNIINNVKVNESARNQKQNA